MRYKNVRIAYQVINELVTQRDFHTINYHVFRVMSNSVDITAIVVAGNAGQRKNSVNFTICFAIFFGIFSVHYSYDNDPT